jgi:drug/metabolite transporter (DMT)-like permease
MVLSPSPASLVVISDAVQQLQSAQHNQQVDEQMTNALSHQLTEMGSDQNGSMKADADSKRSDPKDQVQPQQQHEQQEQPCAVAVDDGDPQNGELTCVERFELCIPRPGIVAMVVAALFFSLNTALAKVLSSNRKYSSFQVLYFRGIVTTIGCTIPLMLARRLPMAQVAGRVDHTLWALARGVIGSISIGALYFGVSELPLTETVVLFGLNPVFAMMSSKLLLDEPLSWLKLLAVPVFLAGVVISANPASYSGESMDTMSWIRRAIVVFGAACSGSAIVFARRMNMAEKLHWAAQGWWQGVVAALLAPAMASLFDFQTVASSEDLGLLIAMGLCALFAQLCVGFAVPHEHAAVIGVLWNFDMVFSLLWQAVMFSNKPKWTDAAGVACVFVASAICVLERPIMEWWEGRNQGIGDDVNVAPLDEANSGSNNEGGNVEMSGTRDGAAKDAASQIHPHIADAAAEGHVVCAPQGGDDHPTYEEETTLLLSKHGSDATQPPPLPPPSYDRHQRGVSVDATWYESVLVSNEETSQAPSPTSAPSMTVSSISRGGRRRTTLAGMTLLDERDPRCCDEEYSSSLAPLRAWMSQCDAAANTSTASAAADASNPLMPPPREGPHHREQAGASCSSGANGISPMAPHYASIMTSG